MISVQDVHVAIDGTPILHGVTFEVEAGSVAGYVGPNGAGKTTTMRLLTGALPPDTGRVIVGGVDVVADPLAAKRRFGYVPEHGHVYESFTPDEYLTFIGRMHRLDEATIRARAAAHLAFWGLADDGDRSMTGFSKGMKQKVLISAALLHDPAVLLLDEPLGGLDAHAVLQTRALLRTLALKGRSVFYSSHLLDAVEKVADLVVVVRDGRILQTGSPEEISAAGGGGSLESAFGKLTAAADAYDEAETLVAQAFD
ncbi:ABC transporter ATP-binding protein [Rubrivirga sp. IMCC45206]|uniref:ABC transporter ATP-binding protein n=1 Tax=Rubrivirga sp. IMCC45206 TaxID=3391614 RepID=UPI00398FF6BC